MTDDAARREFEIHNFAAMAAGGHASPGGIEPSDSVNQGPSEKIISAAAAVSNSGTFNVPVNVDASAKASNSSLDAAVAALTAGDSPPIKMPLISPRVSPPPAPKTTKPASDPIPMYTERVLMPRPLFFGPILPPRVLKEAREAVAEATQELGLEETQTPRLSDLPPDVRNVVGAIEAFGFGLSALRTKDDERENYWKGDSYVSTYQPVWGDEARAARAVKRKRQRTHDTPSPTKASSAAGQTTQEGEAQVTSPGESTSGSSSGVTPQVSNKRADRKKRLATAPKTMSAVPEDETTKSGDSPQATLSPKPSETSNDDKGTTAPMTDANLFSQWARGENDSSPSTKRETLGASSDGKAKSFTPVPLTDLPPLPPLSSPTTDKNMFSMWAGGDGAVSPTVSPKTAEQTSPGAEEAKETPTSDQDLFGKWARGEASSSPSSVPAKGPESPILKSLEDDTDRDSVGVSAEQKQFAKWAQGTNADNPDAMEDTKEPETGIEIPRHFDTFRELTKEDNESDDDSVVGGELKKKVGINENIDAAVASLAKDDGSPAACGAVYDTIEGSLTADEASALLSHVGATTPDGRPLSNLEHSGGCVPLYACDDSSLPMEADLEIYQTKDEQVRHMNVTRSQQTIDKRTLPNIFGSVACPSPSSGPDDSRSWNSRTKPSQKLPRYVGRNALDTPGPSVLPVPQSPARSTRKQAVAQQSPSTIGASSVCSDIDGSTARSVRSSSSINRRPKPPKKRASTSKQKAGVSQYPSNKRVGWWSVAESGIESETTGSDMSPEDPLVLHLPPSEHSSFSTQIKTRLTPTPEKLRMQNRPLSNLHSASTMEKALPFLSDRPPSYRYLQIDTQVVGFPSVEEVEPLFCSLALYHVEPLPGDNPKAVPMPNLKRCGRITELLNFDVVSDPQVETRCSKALYPFADTTKGEEVTQGTRCGVFPIPSNLNIANLYAILIVHKVLSDEADLDPYLKENKNAVYDIEKLRAKAAKASTRRGQFLMPFSFGVAPLIQVLGTDIPTVARSRAVQIPLFHLISGEGDSPIIDQIMVMLNPKGEHPPVGKGGRAANSNGGAAFFVMRNFGYLGLHSVVYGKSSLARDRLVDFTGELQIRRRAAGPDNPDLDFSRHQEERKQYVIPPWHDQIVSEPTICGGRNANDTRLTTFDSGKQAKADHSLGLKRHVSTYRSKLYAQELAPVPLQLDPSLDDSLLLRTPRVSRNDKGNSKDIEPFFRTSFCNELLCYPRVLKFGPRASISIKIELRELEWSEFHQGYLAHLPQHGPSVHNRRRGPFLVQDDFTTCVTYASSPQFLDEFKIKLPLLLQRPGQIGAYALLFSVCHVHLRSKKSWSGMMSLGKRTADEEDLRKSRVDTLACGFLPIMTSGDTRCLIDNGLHDVRLLYSAQACSSDMVENSPALRDGTLILNRLPETKTQKATIKHYRDIDTSTADGAEDGSVGSFSDKQTVDADDPSFRSESVTSENATDSESGHYLRLIGSGDRMMLTVRILVHSSVHPQSACLHEFLRRSPDAPSPLSPLSLGPSSPWRLSRSDLVKHLDAMRTDADKDAGRSDMQKLLLYTVEISNNSLCSQAELTSHFLRVVPQLLRVMISGNGNASLRWANPAEHIPLRAHSLATLLQILVSINTFLMINGVTELDGKTKWSMTSLARVFSMIFDEDSLLSSAQGDQGEVFALDGWLDQLARTPAARSDQSPWKSISESHFGETGDSNMALKGAVKQKEFRSDLDIFLADIASASERESDGLLPEKAATFPRVPEKTEDRSRTSKAAAVKIDSKADFQTALWSGSTDHSSPTSGEIDQDSEFSSWGASTGNTRRKWMTLPSSALATIREDLDDSISNETKKKPSFPLEGADALDTELVRRPPVLNRKQMRVPRVTKPGGDSPNASSLVLASDDVIAAAGAAFLDVVSGDSDSASKDSSGGQPRHRKTLSLSSVDWTSLDVATFLEPASNEAVFETGTEPEIPSKSHISQDRPSLDLGEDKSVAMASLSEEEKNTAAFPGFVDRLTTLCTGQGPGKWCPYLYEVVIFQWVALLDEQKRSGDKLRSTEGLNSSNRPNSDQNSPGSLSDAALRVKGTTVACAPFLFEIIKKSIAWRADEMFRYAVRKGHSKSVKVNPLGRLDEVLLSRLEHLISMITDACLDARNFDSWEFRRASIEVNDAIVRFLRDLFALVETKTVHRLILVYLSRFVVREGKLWQDRESHIGLKCSWEICKLRLNAVTSFVRFPDFVRVNSPSASSWPGWAFAASSNVSPIFYSKALAQFESFNLPGFAATDGPINKTGSVAFPAMHPHWLAELVTDICLAGTDHMEPAIHYRAASLLFELFWTQSQEAQAKGTSSIVASMYSTFLTKILWHIDYFSILPPKSQIRKDVLPCALYVLQCAPAGLKCAVWRELCIQTEGKGHDEKYGGVSDFRRGIEVEETSSADQNLNTSVQDEQKSPNILDMFSLLNLCLSTFEYEGGDGQTETEHGSENSNQLDQWNREFLPAVEQPPSAFRPLVTPRLRAESKKDTETRSYSTTASRRWHAHDAGVVIISTCRQIVREMTSLTKPSRVVSSLDSTSVQGSHQKMRVIEKQDFAHEDTVIFVRGATSVYLHALSLRQSDIVVMRALLASVDIVRTFGITYFLQAVGETLQHWMRVVSMHCGSRRIEVRAKASDFLALILRATWDTFGSFFRVRVPLLAIQTEVMERIVATAATRYYREQRRVTTAIQKLSTASAEASLSPLWRTLDRLHRQSASTNIAFNSAQTRLAENMKKLYRGYIAAHALSTLPRGQSTGSPPRAAGSSAPTPDENGELSAILRSQRIIVNRIINASAGYSKRFVGLQHTEAQRSNLAHYEAIEDAFLDAAYVFSATELPQLRVVWLRKLAEFHSARSNNKEEKYKEEKYAEEATCRFHIHFLLKQAARIYPWLWSSVPFLPWTKEASDCVHLDGEGAAGGSEEYYDDDQFDSASGAEIVFSEMPRGRQVDKSDAFRRVFYRVPNSIRMRTADWEIGGNRNLFYGVTFSSEYETVSPWASRREMEEDMVEEAELAGDLFLEAGITESSRHAWSLAARIHAEKFNYGRLANAYQCLAKVMSSAVPVIDTNNQSMDLSHPLGRFYRVWFHGAAPDELLGEEHVYRAGSSVKLEDFCDKLYGVIQCILPDNTPIHMIVDDGRAEEHRQPRNSQRRGLGPTPLEPAKIKVTALRPLLRQANRIRGTPEWFNSLIEIPLHGSVSSSRSRAAHRMGQAFTRKNSHSFGDIEKGARHRQRDHTGSFSSTVFTSSGSMSSSGLFGRATDVGRNASVDRKTEDSLAGSGSEATNLVGVNKFSFLQPTRKGKFRSSRDWFKSAGDIDEKSFKLTYLQVEHAFPACKARQPVLHRSVSWKSPLEIGVDAVCSWCSVLFRTAVATNGMAVLHATLDQGIGIPAAKVVMDSIYKSRVKDIGLVLLKEQGYVAEESEASYGTLMMEFGRLDEEEIQSLQLKLARGIVVFIELLHVLIARNRDLLRDAMEAKKRAAEAAMNEGPNIPGLSSPDYNARHIRYPSNTSGLSSYVEGMHSSVDGANRYRDDAGALSTTSAPKNNRTEKAIAVQSELQRSFTSLTKALQSNLSTILQDETPRWLKQVSSENYFSSQAYRQTKTRMSEELCFATTEQVNAVPQQEMKPISVVMSLDHHSIESPGGSLHEGSGSVLSRSTADRPRSVPSPLNDERGSSLFQV